MFNNVSNTAPYEVCSYDSIFFSPQSSHQLHWVLTRSPLKTLQYVCVIIFTHSQSHTSNLILLLIPIALAHTESSTATHSSAYCKYNELLLLLCSSAWLSTSYNSFSLFNNTATTDTESSTATYSSTYCKYNALLLLLLFFCLTLNFLQILFLV